MEASERATPRRWKTKAEAAEYLRVSEYQIDQLVREGRLKRYSIRGKRSWRFDTPDLDAVLEAESPDNP